MLTDDIENLKRAARDFYDAVAAEAKRSWMVRAWLVVGALLLLAWIADR